MKRQTKWETRHRKENSVSERVRSYKTQGEDKGSLLRDVEEKNRDSFLDEYIWVGESGEQQDREHRAEEQNGGRREMKPEEVERAQGSEMGKWDGSCGAKISSSLDVKVHAVQQVWAIFPDQILIPQSCCMMNRRQWQTRKHRSTLS